MASSGRAVPSWEAQRVAQRENTKLIQLDRSEVVMFQQAASWKRMLAHTMLPKKKMTTTLMMTLTRVQMSNVTLVVYSIQENYRKYML